MSIPLIMTGPGGDYTTRYDIKGQALVRQIGATLKSQPDADSGSGSAGYFKQPRGKRKTAGQRLSGGPTGGLPLASADRQADRLAADVFVHHQETDLDMLARTGSGLYQAPGHAGQPGRTANEASATVPQMGAQVAPGAQVAQVAQVAKLTPAMYQAIKTWLDLQGRALGVLSQEAVTLNQANQMIAGRRRSLDKMDKADQLDPRVSADQRNESEVEGLARGHQTRADRQDTYAAQTEAGHRLMALEHAAFTEVDDHGDESDSQATEDPHTDSRLAFDTRLFADHAGTRPGVGRQQGYGLRARRSADQKGGLATAAKQGSLFGGESRY